MRLFELTVYADDSHRIACFNAYVWGNDLASAVSLLKRELSIIPCRLYAASDAGEVDQMPLDRGGLELPTESSHIMLLRLD